MSRILKWEREKDPDEFLDYSINWEHQIGSDPISTSVWSYAGNPDSPPLVLSSSSIATPITTIWLNAGDGGTTYLLTNRITTVGGRIMDQTVRLRMQQR